MLKRAREVLIVAVMMVSTAVAGPVEDGLHAYLKSDFNTALRLWRPRAEQGDPRAQWRVGLM